MNSDQIQTFMNFGYVAIISFGFMIGIELARAFSFWKWWGYGLKRCFYDLVLGYRCWAWILFHAFLARLGYKSSSTTAEFL